MTVAPPTQIKRDVPQLFRRTFGVTVAVILLACIAFIHPAPPSPVLRLGVQSWTGYAPAYLARSNGSWPSDIVRPVELPTDAEIVRAMCSNALESGCLTLDGAFRVQASGVDVRVLAVLDYSAGGDAVVATTPGIRSIQELRGKRVAVEKYGVGMLFLARVLRASGMKLSDVVIVNADMPEHDQLIAEHRTDAVVTYSPHKDRIMANGGIVLVDSTQFSGDVIDVLLIRADTLTDNPDAVRALFKGWEDAAELFVTDANAKAVVARAMALSSVEMSEGLQQIRVPNRVESRELVLGPTPKLLKASQETAEQLTTLGLLRANLEPKRLFLTPKEAEVLLR